MPIKIITIEEINKITHEIDDLERLLNINPDPTTALLLEKCHTELEKLGLQYDVINKELTINL